MAANPLITQHWTRVRTAFTMQVDEEAAAVKFKLGRIAQALPHADPRRSRWVAALLWWPCIASAQATKPQPTPLDAIVVSATRAAEDALTVPAAIDVVDATDIRRAQPAIQLSESLSRVPGVVARDRQNQAQDLQISIRGFGARASFGVRGVRLYSDGIPASMPDGQGQVSHFALAAADRIEVLRGPYSALYGNASGGVIALFTADAPANAQLDVGLVAGSDGLQRRTLSWHAPWGVERNNSVLLDVSELDSDGYRDHSSARRRNAQALIKGSFGAAGHFTVLANALDLEADDPQGLTAAELRGNRRAASPGALNFDTRKTVRQTQHGANIDYPLSAAHGLVATLWTGQRATAQMLSVPVAAQRNALNGGGAIDLDRDYAGADARWRWSTKTMSLIAGLQYEVADEHRRGFENFLGDELGVRGVLRRDEDNRVRGQDVYAQVDWSPTARWRLNAGVRHSDVRFESRDHYITANNPDDSGALGYARTSPVAGVLFRAAPWMSLYANAGAGFETPTFAELAYRSDGGSGLHRSLRPARSRNHELGLRARRTTWQGAAAIFQSDTRDELVVVANQGGRSVFANAGLTRRRGLELALSGEWFAHWHFASAYTWLDARYRSDFARCATPPCTDADLLIAAGRRLPGLSRHFAWSELRYTPVPAVDLMLEGHLADRVFADDRNSASAPAYASFDLAGERRFDVAGLQWRAYARLNNVFDRAIIGSVIVNDSFGRYFEPAPGRHWVIGLNIGRSFD